MLAALRPISNGIIADTTSEGRRGKIFGRVQAANCFGMFVTSMIAVNMANKEIAGFHGWRVAFLLMGMIAGLVALLVGFLMPEPPHSEEAGPARTGCAAVLEEIMDLLKFFRIPTFCVMITQGIFGTIPWTVMGNMTLYFQLCGQSDGNASVLSGASTLCGAFGNILGGYVSDGLSRRFGLYGRPLNAQVTVSIALPMMFLIFYGVSPEHGNFWLYLALIVIFGLLGSWAQSGTNFPVLSEIVPASNRSRVMAWEGALEHSLASAIGPPLVALLATALGYQFSEREAAGVSLSSARALGSAMAAVICIPWAVCFCAYTMLHWTYPRDVCRLQAHGAAPATAAEGKGEAGKDAAVVADMEEQVENASVAER